MDARATKSDHDMITEIHASVAGRGGLLDRVDDVEMVSTENRKRLNVLAGATGAVIVIGTILGGILSFS